MNFVPPECSHPQLESAARDRQNYRNPISTLRLSSPPLLQTLTDFREVLYGFRAVGELPVSVLHVGLAV